MDANDTGPSAAAEHDIEDPVSLAGDSSPGTRPARARRPRAMPPGRAPRPSSRSRADTDGDPFRLLAERSRDLVFRYRLVPEPGFDYVSPSATAMTGYTPEEHYADPELGLKLVHPDDRELLARASVGAPEPLVLRWKRRDGSVLWTEQHNVPILENGALVAIEGSARDVTAREQAREGLELAERRLRTLLEQVDLLAGSIDLAGRVTFMNAALLRATGWQAAQVEGRDWFTTVIPAAGRAAMRAAFAADVAAGTFDRVITTDLLVRDGPPRRVRLHAMGIVDRTGSLAGVALLGEDLAALEEHEARIERLTSAIEQTADAVVITDPEARITYVNPAFEQLTGYRREEVLGRNPRLLQSGRHAPAFYRRMWRTLAAGSSWTGELVNRRRDGGILVEEATITPITARDGTVTAYVGVKRDVTRIRELSQTLDAARRHRAELAAAIAGLSVGPTVEVTAERIASAAMTIPDAQVGGVIAFENGSTARVLGLATDVDLPLAVGDTLPAERAEYLRERASQGPWVERWPARATNDPYIGAIAAAGVRAVLYAPLDEGGGLGLVAVAVTKPAAVSGLAHQLPALVEIAAVARSLIGASLAARATALEAAARVLATVERRAFRPHFQPIVELATGRRVGYEALTRFADGRRADHVFTEARLAGLGILLEVATLEAALDEARALPGDAWLSLNVSAALVLENGHLRAILSRRTRPLVLEITEHETVADYAAFREAIAALGPDVRVAADDTGAGVANMTHLVELRPDLVKVDLHLVRGINADLTRQAMVAGLCHFALVAGSEVIAEGVETEAERLTLERLGVDHAQGYLLGRPAPATAWMP